MGEALNVLRRECVTEGLLRPFPKVIAAAEAAEAGGGEGEEALATVLGGGGDDEGGGFERTEIAGERGAVHAEAMGEFRAADLAGAGNVDEDGVLGDGESGGGEGGVVEAGDFARGAAELGATAGAEVAGKVPFFWRRHSKSV